MSHFLLTLTSPPVTGTSSHYLLTLFRHRTVLNLTIQPITEPVGWTGLLSIMRLMKRYQCYTCYWYNWMRLYYAVSAYLTIWSTTWKSISFLFYTNDIRRICLHFPFQDDFLLMSTWYYFYFLQLVSSMTSFLCHF